MPELIFYSLEVCTSSNDAPAEAAQFTIRIRCPEKLAQYLLKTQRSTALLQDHHSFLFQILFFLLFLFLK